MFKWQKCSWNSFQEKERGVSGHIVSPLPQVHHDSLLSFKENWRHFLSSIDYFEIAPHVAFPSSDLAHLPFWMMKVKIKVEKPQYYQQIVIGILSLSILFSSKLCFWLSKFKIVLSTCLLAAVLCNFDMTFQL